MIFTLPLDLGIIAAFILACFGLGRRVQTQLGWAGGAGILEEFLISAGFGLVGISYLTLAIGYLGFLYRSVFLAVLALLLWLTRREIAAFSRGMNGRVTGAEAGAVAAVSGEAGLSRVEKVLLGILLTAALANLLFNYCPPTAEDETMLHLGIPAKWLANHAIYSLPGVSGQYFPSGILTQYTLLAAVGSIQTARLFHYVSGLFCLAVVYLLAKNFLERRSALLAAALFYTLPVVTSLSGVGNTDLGTLLYGLLAVFAFFKWLSEKSRGRLLTSAIFTGAHLACKYSAFPLMLILPVLILYEERRGLTRAFKAAVVFAAVSFSVLLPYLVRNAIITGNPLYPKKFFGLPYDEHLYLMFFNNAESVFNLFGKIGDLSAGGVIWGIGPVFAAFLPFIFLFKVRDAAGRNISLFLFVIGALNYLLLFAAGISFQLSRHSLLTFAILSVPIAGAITQIYRTMNMRGYIIALLFMSFSANLALPFYFGAKRLPVFLGLESRRKYFDREYDILEQSFFVRYINSELPEKAGILFINIPAPQLNYTRYRIFGMNALDKDFYRFTPAAALAEMEKLDIEYIVAVGDGINKPGAEKLCWTAWTGGETKLPIRWFSPELLKPVMTHGNVSLYMRVKPG